MVEPQSEEGVCAFYALESAEPFDAAFAILHGWIWLFGGRAPYEKTYQLAVYAATPGMLFGWVPVLGGVGMIWNVILLVVGVQATHKVSLLRALMMFVVVPLMIAIILIVAFFGTILYLFSQTGQFGGV